MIIVTGSVDDTETSILTSFLIYDTKSPTPNRGIERTARRPIH